MIGSQSVAEINEFLLQRCRCIIPVVEVNVYFSEAPAGEFRERGDKVGVIFVCREEEAVLGGTPSASLNSATASG